MRSRQFFGRLFAALVALFALGIFAVSPAAAADGDTLEVELTGYEGFDFNGTAVITEENGTIRVDIKVSGEDVVGGHPVHIHLGTCNELDPNPTYSLADIDDEGSSVSEVDGVTLDDLLAEPYAINAHLSATDIPTYVSCGDIALAADGGEEDDATDEEAAPADDEADDAAEEEAVAEATPDAVGGGDTGGAVTTVPTSGVGSAARSQADMSAFLTVIGSLAALLVVAGVTMRMREERARR